VPFWDLGLARCFSLFHLVKNFAHHAAECRGAVWFLQVVGLGRGGRNAFRILRITAGKENGQTWEQSREPLRHGGSAKFGHDEVQNRQGGPFFFAEPQGLLPIAGREYTVTEVYERLARHLPDGFMIVGYQYGFRTAHLNKRRSRHFDR